MFTTDKNGMLKSLPMPGIALLVVALLFFIGSLDKAKAQTKKLKNTQGEQIKVDEAARKSGQGL